MPLADAVPPADDEAPAAAGPPRYGVVMLLTSFEVSGAERVAGRLAQALAARGHPLCVAALQGPGPLGEQSAAAGIETRALGLRRRDFARAPAAVAALLFARRPALVNSHLWHANTLAALALAGRDARARPALVTVRQVVEHRPRPWRHWADRLLARVVDAEVCASAAVVQHARARGPAPRRRVVIPNASPRAPLAPEAARAARVARRAEWGCGPDLPVLGFVGRLHEQKGLDRLPAALAHPAAPRDALLVLVGAGAEEEALARQVRAAGLGDRVRFVGRREDVAECLAAFDVYCSPARAEGLPLAVLEAMAAGLPLVLSDIAPHREAAGDTARYVEAADAGALAAALARAVAGPRANPAARARAFARFAPAAMIDAYVRVFDRAVACRAAP